MTDNKKRGRSKAINPRSKQYRIRLTDDECEALKTIAKKHNLSISKLIRSRIIEGEYQMTINEYQKAAYRTANQSLTDSQQLQNGLIGLNGESGECIDILKKHLFQGHDLDKYHIAKELGDVAWYLAVSAQALGFDLETILQMNVEKLKARYPHGFDAGHSQLCRKTTPPLLYSFA